MIALARTGSSRVRPRGRAAACATFAATVLAVVAGLAAPAHVALAGPADGAVRPVAENRAYQVDIRNFAFAPATITVPAGTRIVWTNRDEEPHLIVSTNGAFKASKALDTNDSFETVLEKPGTYAYYCGIHPMMVGKIVVK
jgi:plastocyanin